MIVSITGRRHRLSIRYFRSIIMGERYHFIGIGGIGMSGIARLLLGAGCRVSGSDAKENAMTKLLAKQGARVFIGHDARNVPDADYVVYSSAVKEDNPEIREARRRGIPVIQRAEALAQLMRDKKVICIAGSHGKTTTTSLAAHMLLEAGLSPTVVIGGNLKNIDANAAAGAGEFFCAEADESDGSFLHYSPLYSVITNIDREHLDHYRTFDAVIAAYGEFMNRRRPEGCLFCCGDDENLVRLCRSSKRRHVLFGFGEACGMTARNIRIEGLSSVFDCVYEGAPAGSFHLSAGGLHNISNALAVIALGIELKIDAGTIGRALATFQGAGRRLDIKWHDKDCMIIDDYAHHPTEIRATLAAVRHLSCKRLVAVFQPHRYSRTKLLLDDFARCFGDADRVVLTDIYPASEPPVPGVDAGLVASAIRGYAPDKPVDVVPKHELMGYVRRIITSGDIVLMLGAGDITRISDELAVELSRTL
ncbi:MAG: UDP-N-acetylmuramate--L-alanine ligase [Candidatus Omnitrophica bacterium]|nr:UDP-N-acetylmuramate--L-alanine ligase [Candidatus Omnitrophota bacterium]